VPKTSGKMTDWERAICARLKTIREAIRWSQSAFAEQLGISKDQLASIEYGRTPLRYDIAWRLRQGFGISLRWLEEGVGIADHAEHDALPMPGATGLSPRVLLSKVVRNFPFGRSEKLVPVGPEAPAIGKPKAAAKAKLSEKNSDPAKIAKAVTAVIGGRESATGKTDAMHRAIHEAFLKGMVEDWIASAPLSKVEELTNLLMRTVNGFLSSFPDQPVAEIDARSDAVMWERIRAANARRILVAKEFHKKGLTDVDALVTLPPVKSQLKNLLADANRLTEEPGKKSELADFLGAPLASVSRWLSGKREPGGEITLQLLRWVKQQEGTKKNP
jgi:transcriptional regulator with XRE-family HTH domain